MGKFQRGDRVRHAAKNITGLVTKVDHNSLGEDSLFLVLYDGATRYDESKFFTHVTESLAVLPPVMGERLIYKGEEVAYLAFNGTLSTPHLIQYKNGLCFWIEIEKLSRPKRTKTFKGVLTYHPIEGYQVTRQEESCRPYAVVVLEFSHEVPND